jgi:hypothetical protein
MSADDTVSGEVEGIYIETAHEFWGIPIPDAAKIDMSEQYDGLLLMEPRSEYDRCIIGVVERFNDRFVLYSKQCILQQLQLGIEDEEYGDRYEQAIEWFEFNMRGAYVGEATPGFLEDVDE